MSGKEVEERRTAAEKQTLNVQRSTSNAQRSTLNAQVAEVRLKAWSVVVTCRLGLAGVVFARSSLEFSVNLAKWLAKLRRRKAG